MEFTEMWRTGSLEGEHDAFGRVMDAKLSNENEVIVADGLAQRIVVFDANGTFVRSFGRGGQGPGEFGVPVLVGVDPHDSVFVWDSRLARISVFTTRGEFVRSFRVMPSWAVTGVEFLPDGRLLVAGYSLGDVGGLHLLDREGNLIRSFSDPPYVPEVAAYERSLLGGHTARGSDWFVYSIRSPYELRFFSRDQRPTYRCQGAANWTTRPEDVVEEVGRVSRLQYGRFIHSARVLALSDSLVMNVIFDPVNGRQILDLLTTKCEWLRRQTIDLSLALTDLRNGRMVAVQNLGYPEVVVYLVSTSPDHRMPN